MPKKAQVLTLNEAEEEVKKIARLCGLMFYHFTRTLAEKFGEETGTEIAKEVVKRFGLERGNRIKEKVLKKGLKLTLRNFEKFSDLPKIGWGGRKRETFCPFAETWIEKGAEELCEVYCDVDLWKTEGYNPKIKLKRVKWVLKGDDYCSYEMKETP